MRSKLIGAASAAAIGLLAFGVANADPAPADTAVVPQGTVSGSYSYLTANHGANANIWSVQGAGIAPVMGDFSVQLKAGYDGLGLKGGDFNNWRVSGAASWDSARGRLGVNSGFDALNGLGTNLDFVNYGAYGEFYVGPRITLGLRGGGATGWASALGARSNDFNGGYVGGEGIYYLMPDLDAQGHVEYDTVGGLRQTNVGLQAEYLYSQDLPISGWVGYDYTHFDGAGVSLDDNKFSVGLRYYIGGSGSLVNHQRTGVDDWATAPLAFLR
ncbi:MAG: hypothetical protein ACREEW_19145 [Caulobacteraceae bacterium]